MWLVRYVLQYRYTVAVLAIFIFLFGVLSIPKMSTDILPQVDAPELNVVWTYTGLSAREMAARVTTYAEIALLNNVDDIKEVRSTTTDGIGLIRMTFQPGVNMAVAQAQATSVSQTVLRPMPNGMNPPLIVRSSPSSVPIIQLVVSSDRLGPGQLSDYARLMLRAQLQSVPGMRISQPYGGAARQVMIDVDPDALHAFDITVAEVNAALARQNLTLPSGNLREGNRELPVQLNASPKKIDEFLDLPIRTIKERTILLRDVANVRDGEAIPTNIARLNGQNAVMVSILKLGNASTIDIINGILERLPEIRAAAPEGVMIEAIFDQSVFVRAAVVGVQHEIILVAALVALVVLLFLGSWRSTLIVLTAIPLALLSSVIGLNLVGATFNLMTLGGLALAIGILVDNALVEIENTKRHVALGKPVRQAILDSAAEVAFPEFVSTLSICIVFTPIFLLTGTAADVFRPLAQAVIFSMIASYVLARSLVPTLASLILPTEERIEQKNARHTPRGFARIHHGVEALFEKIGSLQSAILRRFLTHKWLVAIPVLILLAIGSFSFLHAEREFFPKADAGLIRLFLRAEPGLRLDDTATTVARVHSEIRKLIPADELQFVVENIGMPISNNLAWVDSPAATTADAELLIQLHDKHSPSAGYENALREMLKEKFPRLQFFFQPADSTSQTLSSGAPTTFEIRFSGRDQAGNLKLAAQMEERLKTIDGIADVALREVLHRPGYHVQVDRQRASTLGISPSDVAATILASLGAGSTVTSNFWMDPVVGTSYQVQVMIPPARLTSMEEMMNLNVRAGEGSSIVPLRAFAEVHPNETPGSISRTTLKPTFTIVANATQRDLGALTAKIESILHELRPELKPGNSIELHGQAALMTRSYSELLGGLGLAAVLVFLIMVVNFQSWTLPFVAISGLPIAISGAFFGLWVTHTPISVPALMGVIMVVGVSTANSVLVTAFARDCWESGMSVLECAFEAARTRLRPVSMTALAMILGVIPMAIGHAQGGEQNAPLGRAVIGGLLFGTLATLLLIPIMFAILRRDAKAEKPKTSEASAKSSPS